jgi:serine/threonine-protein kinase
MAEMNLVGRTLGRFEILAELGWGGMAVVYKARQTAPNRIVALKVALPELSRNPQYLARFHQEADSAAALEHPHIVPIYAVDEADGVHFIAMKYIAGQTLKELVEAQGALSVTQAAAILDQVAEALDYAHRCGIVHRDIKPSNIMIEQGGWVYLTDFGLARGMTTTGLTQSGMVMGTPEYMSPEQAEGQVEVGPASDIYALGVVVYELLTGALPFNDETPIAALVARLQRGPRPPREYRADLPMPVEDVVMQALARRPEARFAGAGELTQALKRAAGLDLGAQIPAAQSTIRLPKVEHSASPSYAAPRTGPTIIAPRPTTPPAVHAAAFAGSAAAHVSPTAERAPTPSGRVRRRGWAAVVLMLFGVVSLLLAISSGALLRFGRTDRQVAQALAQGAAALEQPGALDRAFEAYNEALTLDPRNAEAYAQLALIANLRGRANDAEAAARSALEYGGDDAFVYAMLADALNSLGDREGALEAAHKAVELDAELSAGYAVRAVIVADQAAEGGEANLAQALVNADLSIAQAADEGKLAQALAYSARGYVHRQQYDLMGTATSLRDGSEDYNRAIALQEQAAFRTSLGYFFQLQNDGPQAVEQFQRALTIDPQYGPAHTGLGWYRYYQQDYAGALVAFEQALGLNARDVDAYMGKSSAYQAQEPPDDERAIEELKQAAQIAPTSAQVFESLGWAQRSKAIRLAYGSAAQQAAYAEAEAAFRQAITVNPNWANARTGLGWALQDQAELFKRPELYQESIAALQQSLELREDQAPAHTALGWSYVGLGRYADAEASFRRATALLGDYADAFYGLGEALAAQGKTEEARAAYQQAADKGSEKARAALER